MNIKLAPYTPSIFEITGQLKKNKDELILHFLLKGKLSELIIPPLNSSQLFKDGLWEHTCFEFFIKDLNEKSYTEFNFSPTGDYAIYKFSDYRQRNEKMKCDFIPQIKASQKENELSLNVCLPTLSGQIALSAILENKNNEKEYFALIHPDKKPDFHSPASFILTL